MHIFIHLILDFESFVKIVDYVSTEGSATDLYFEFKLPAHCYLRLLVLTSSLPSVRFADSSWEPRSTPG